MSGEVTVYEGAIGALEPSHLKAQVNLIQEVMRDVMKKDEHYGVIPGTGNKPSLLKPGAEKLIMTFRLTPELEVKITELGDGHREVTVQANIYTNRRDGTKMFLGSGVGSCSTMESKYRYRTGPVTPTGLDVPKEYWNLRKENPGKAQELLGGKGYSTKKIDGQWQIVEQGERIENPDIADVYNTVLKMAKKRALVDAVLTVTAASDIFTQDVEDMNPADLGGKGGKSDTPPPQKPQEKPKEQPAATGQDNILTDTGLLQEISQKSGETKGKPWTLYGVKVNDNWYNTFDKKLADIAHTAEGKTVMVEFTHGKKSKDLVGIIIIDKPENLPL